MNKQNLLSNIAALLQIIASTEEYSDVVVTDRDKWEIEELRDELNKGLNKLND